MIEQFVTNVLLIYELFSLFVSNVFNFDMVKTKKNMNGNRLTWRGGRRGIYSDETGDMARSVGLAAPLFAWRLR
ncbi:hypothetical protein [Geobacillus subterraneus]|uniref:hypothetical protein n=1 Tax=Geobacillus subterraneus TaxID=129338 RepID=UPI001619B8ED